MKILGISLKDKKTASMSLQVQAGGTVEADRTQINHMALRP